MSTTLSSSTDTWTALALDGFSVSREGRNVLHAILGSNEKAVSIREAGLRTGTLKLLFGTYTLAAAVLDSLSTGEVHTLADTVEPGAGLDLVLSGEVSVELEDDSLSVWWVEFDFEEVLS